MLELVHVLHSPLCGRGCRASRIQTSSQFAAELEKMLQRGLQACAAFMASRTITSITKFTLHTASLCPECCVDELSPSVLNFTKGSREGPPSLARSQSHRLRGILVHNLFCKERPRSCGMGRGCYKDTGARVHSSGPYFQLRTPPGRDGQQLTEARPQAVRWHRKMGVISGFLLASGPSQPQEYSRPLRSRALLQRTRPRKTTLYYSQTPTRVVHGAGKGRRAVHSYWISFLTAAMMDAGSYPW